MGMKKLSEVLQDLGHFGLGWPGPVPGKTACVSHAATAVSGALHDEATIYKHRRQILVLMGLVCQTRPSRNWRCW